MIGTELLTTLPY